MRNNKLLWGLASIVAAGCQGGIDVEGTLPERMAVDQDASVAVDGAVRIQTTDRELLIERARMMLSEVEVEGSTEASEVDVGPTVLELALDGVPTSIGVSDVPAGKYQELGLEMARGDRPDAAGSEDFGGEVPASIIVEGMVDGEPFEFRSRYAAELEFDLGELRVRDDEIATVTVTFDVAAWFFDSDGNLLDPRDPANRATIDGNVEQSVAAFAEVEDDDDD